MLNLDRLSFLETVFQSEEDALITYFFDLSNQIKIEKRIVNSIPSVLGSVFGLKDLLSILITFLIGRFQAKAFTFDMIANLFRVDMGTSPLIQIRDTSPGEVFRIRTSFKVLRLKGWSCF